MTQAPTSPAIPRGRGRQPLGHSIQSGSLLDPRSVGSEAGANNNERALVQALRQGASQSVSQTGQQGEPAKLIAPILADFIAGNLAFAELRRERISSGHRAQQDRLKTGFTPIPLSRSFRRPAPAGSAEDRRKAVRRVARDCHRELQSDLQLGTRAELWKDFRTKPVPTSGGSAPTRRSVRVDAAGLGSGTGRRAGFGRRLSRGPWLWLRSWRWRRRCPALSASAVAFLSRNTAGSNATSSGASNSWNHTRS